MLSVHTMISLQTILKNKLHRMDTEIPILAEIKVDMKIRDTADTDMGITMTMRKMKKKWEVLKTMEKKLKM